MRRKTKLKLIAAITTSVVGLQFVHCVRAANGTWTNTSGGMWSTPTNWSASTVASGAGATADFSTITPSAAGNLVNLDAPFTVGTLKFNSATTANNFNVSNNGVSSNILTLDNGSSQPVITVGTLLDNFTISATIAGTNGFIKTGNGSLTLTASNTYSGQTTINSTSGNTGGQSADLYLANNNSLGTSTLFIDPGSTAFARVLVDAGVVIPNNITINTSRTATGGNGTLMPNNNGTNNSTISGTGFSGAITINNIAGSGGHICGVTDNSLTYFMTFSGPITLSPAYYTANGVTAPTATGKGLLIRSGNVIFSGGGSYFRAELRSGELRDGANNGIATNAYIDIGINANGNPLSNAEVDLDGFNQTLVGLSNINSPTSGFNDSVTNSSTAPSVLTLTPLPASNISSGLVFEAGGSGGTGNNAFISDNGANGGILSVVINGDPTGVQSFNTPVSSYTGSTTLLSSTLSINTLANGGSSSSIGASTNVATNLVFGGGQLNFSGGSTSTDRNFTINTGATAVLSVNNLATTLTMTGGGTGAGGFTKKGLGTLVMGASNSYTGPTLISAGTLLVNNTPGLAAASAVTISSGATLGGTGTAAGSVTPAAGGIIAPGGVNNVGTLTVGALTLNTGSILNLEFGSGNDEITVANSGGLTVNGANINLYNTGTTTSFSTNGTYPLFNVTGSVGGSLSSFSVADPAAGKVYSLSNSGGVVSLTIVTGTVLEWNNNSASTKYADTGNWIGGVVPNSVGQTALFGSNLVGSNGTVNLTTAETVSGISFNNTGVSYSLSGSGSLILNNGVAAAAVDVLNGTHSINVPIALSGATALDTTNPSDALTITGNISGAKSVAVNGPGTVTLTGTNGFTSVAVNGSTLNVGSGTTGTLGSGPVTLAAAASLNFNTGGSYNFGQSITGAGTGESVNQIGPGTVTVGAINSMGAVNVSNGSLVGTSINAAGINVTGSGTLTASGGLSGTAMLIVNTSGTVSVGAASSYTGGTEVDAGKLTLNAPGALPALSVLAVNGGTLDLHGNNISISNEVETTTGGIITNSVAATTATISLTGLNNNYNISAGLNDGPSGGKVALFSFIDNTTSSPDGVGNEYSLALNAPGNFSGGTIVSKESLQANVTNALGTGPVVFNLNNTSTNNSRLNIVGGVTLPNNITFAQGNPYAGFGDIQYITTTSGTATINGSVTINADQFSGGVFGGPTNAGDALDINGPVFAAGTATTISVRTGNVGFAGGGSYQIMNDYGTILVNATNGMCPTAQFVYVQGAPVLDLNGNSQTLAGITIASGSGTVQNSNSSNPGTLTLNTTVADPFGGAITGNLSIVKAGAANLSLSGNLTYTGTTQVSGGSLTFSAVSQGGFLPITLPGALNLGAGTLTNIPAVTVQGNRTLLTIGSLNIAGATNAWTGSIDLANNDMDINTGSLATLDNQLHQGFVHGWNSTGGINSTVAAADTTHLTALGAIQNNQSGNALYSNFDGGSTNPGDLLIKYTYYGDANLDGQVDGSDYSLIDSGFLTGATGWFNGDFNYDGVVNGSDYTLIDNAFNSQGASLAALIAGPTATVTDQLAAGSGNSSVPEPTTLAMLGMGAAGLLGRRRRAR